MEPVEGFLVEGEVARSESPVAALLLFELFPELEGKRPLAVDGGVEGDGLRRSLPPCTWMIPKNG